VVGHPPIDPFAEPFVRSTPPHWAWPLEKRGNEIKPDQRSLGRCPTRVHPLIGEEMDTLFVLSWETGPLVARKGGKPDYASL
jgi:hypothetical protein